jgi:hypothetical protein
MGTGVAVGGSGVNVCEAVGVKVGWFPKNEAQAESPSALRSVKDIQMNFLGWENIAPIIR